MNKVYLEIKEELKALARKIKKQKFKKKEMCRKHQDTWRIDADIENDKTMFRHKHIARCLLSGREYEQIEQPRKGNEPSWESIDRYKERFVKKYKAEAAIRLSAVEVELQAVSR